MHNQYGHCFVEMTQHEYLNIHVASLKCFASIFQTEHCFSSFSFQLNIVALE